MAARTAVKERPPVLVTDLTGGLDRRTAATLLKPSRAQQLMNVRLSVPGRWRPRPGWANVSGTSLGTGRAQGGERIYVEGTTPFTIIAWDGDIYTPSDAGVWGSPVTTGFDTLNPIDFPSDASIVAVFDGVTTPQRSADGVTWRQLGLTAPTSAGTVSAVGPGGFLIDGHEYELSYTYEGELDAFESNESPAASVTVVAPNKIARIVADASTDPQVTTVNVYARDVTLGESQRRFASSIANPGSGTVTVELTANTWDEASEAPTNHNPAPPLEFGVVWKGRWWAKDPSSPITIRFSELFLPQAWPTNYTIDLPFTRGDHITAIMPLGDTLVVMGTAKPAFLIIGITALDFDVRPSAASQAGCFGFRAWDLLDGAIVHASAEGVYVFDGAADRLLTEDLDQDWRDVVDATSEDDLSRVPVVYDADQRELRVGLSVQPLTGSPGEMVMDLARTARSKTPAWSMTDRAIGGYLHWDGPEVTTGNRGRLFSWGLTEGRIYEENSGTSANGDDLVAQYRGPTFTTGLLVSRFTALYGEFSPANGLFTIAVNVDGSSVMTTTVDLHSSSLSRFGSALFGTSVFGSGERRMFSIDLPLTAEGRGLTVTGTYQGQDVFDWYTYGFMYQPEQAIRGMV